jgi:hypothetical protein
MRVGQELGVALKSFADRCEAEVGTRGGLILTKVCLGQPEGKKSAGSTGQSKRASTVELLRDVTS